MESDVFISYSHKDKNVADAICFNLETNHLCCWYAPRDIVPSSDWASSIIDAINTTKVLVLVFTENSNISPQVLREVSNAVNAGVTIVPFRLTEEEPVAGIKYYLSTVHWLDAMDEELNASIGNLVKLCQAIVKVRESEEALEPAVPKPAPAAEPAGKPASDTVLAGSRR